MYEELNMNIYAATRKGKNKEYSEDRIVVGNIILNDEERLFENISPAIAGISDGVGGNDGGELASQFICEKALSLKENDIIHKAEEINRNLIKYALGVKGKEKMATTFSAVIFGENPQFFHIGNTRIYSVQGSYLKQLTTDHTTYNYLRFRGLYEEAESCNKSEIVSCFGGGTDRLFNPDTENINARKTVITSDGIHDHVDIDCMEDIICSEKSCAEKCAELMKTALENGSCDDMSIILIF